MKPFIKLFLMARDYMAFVILACIFSTKISTYAQVANDDCASAYDLGWLDGYGYCYPLGMYRDTCLIGSNTNAVQNFPYYSLSGCSGYIQTTASPAKDVWYKFIGIPCFYFAISTVYSVSPFTPIDTLHLSIYGGDDCSSLSGVKCYTVDSNNFYLMDTIRFPYGAPPKNVYMQISGNSVNVTGGFWIELNGLGCAWSSAVYQGSNINIQCFDYKITSNNPTIKCINDGNASVTINTGNPPYTYNWSDGNTNSNRTNMSQGKYYVTITDTNGCSEIDSVTLVGPGGTDLSISVTSKHVTCNGAYDGAASILVSGGFPPYTYKWTDPASSTNDSVANLPATTFSVNVTDSNGCNTISAVTITQPPDILLKIDSLPDSANTGNGKAWVSVTGGTSPYIYQWNDLALQTKDTAFNLLSGMYNVVVTDSNGCSDSSSVVVNNFVGISEKTFENNVCIFPNPTNGHFTLMMLPEAVKAGASVFLYNVLNEIVFRMDKIDKPYHDFDFSNFPKGIYFIQVINSNDQYVNKVILN